MKKEVKKLRLNKMTISNLDASEMNQRFGGAKPNTQNLDCSVTLNTLCTCPGTFGSICCPINY
ncbi:class I lanthipeptide [Segetibacter koreensis]|uniref:class I lanthipeptide n=1 Tax=Segetibacter koreensis TaxID=398037 RepID=UPI00037E6D6A|nr:class I lanthipeptide [Segetibacter koreensis]